MQISRLFRIVYILLDKKIVTAKKLAEYFEVSVRTIYRDVDTLSQAGIPIYTSRGKNGGISLMEDFILNKSLLSEKEQNEILLGLQSLSATKFLKEEETISKISSLFQKEAASWIEIDFSGWAYDDTVERQFELLRKAILERRRIVFQYYNAEGEASERKAEPIKLIFKQKEWYFYAFCLNKKDYRIFKISRMENLSITEYFFETHSLVNQISMKENDFSNLTFISLKLIFSEKAAYRVFDEFPKDKIKKQKNGSFLVEISYPDNNWVISYLLSFGSEVEVIEPLTLREQMKINLKKMLEKYDS